VHVRARVVVGGRFGPVKTAIGRALAEHAVRGTCAARAPHVLDRAPCVLGRAVSRGRQLGSVWRAGDGDAQLVPGLEVHEPGRDARRRVFAVALVHEPYGRRAHVRGDRCPRGFERVASGRVRQPRAPAAPTGQNTKDMLRLRVRVAYIGCGASARSTGTCTRRETGGGSMPVAERVTRRWAGVSGRCNGGQGIQTSGGVLPEPDPEPELEPEELDDPDEDALCAREGPPRARGTNVSGSSGSASAPAPARTAGAACARWSSSSALGKGGRAGRAKTRRAGGAGGGATSASASASSASSNGDLVRGRLPRRAGGRGGTARPASSFSSASDGVAGRRRLRAAGRGAGGATGWSTSDEAVVLDAAAASRLLGPALGCTSH
jgi:hypothetical protein